MATPANREPPCVKRIWSAAGSMEWTGCTRFAPHLQLLSLLLATTQTALGCYILGSLVQYGKWTEACHSAFARDFDHVPHTLRPPFTMYTQDDPATGMLKHWVGNFGALEGRGYPVIYALILPLSTFFIAATASWAHFLAPSLPSLRRALYFGVWQVFEIVLYYYFTGSYLTVDWPYTQPSFKDARVCFVDQERGGAIAILRRTRKACAEARKGVAAVAGVVGLVYLILIIISICQTYRQVRRAQHTYTANLRLQELQASDTRRQCSDNGRSDAAAIPLPDSPLQPHSGEAGHISQRRSSTESATRENDILDEDVEDLGEPIRPRDMV